MLPVKSPIVHSTTMEQPPDRRPVRTRLRQADLRAAWEEHAAEFIAWARQPRHDSYAQFHRDLFLEFLPPPGDKTLDLGCGEGRLSRDLKALGHHVIAVDASPTMIAAALEADPEIEAVVGDAAALPFANAAFDCVIAFMSLQDVDDLDGALRETARVLQPAGRLCLAVVHPLSSAGRFESDDLDAPFTIRESYLEPSFYADNVVRDGLEITFVSAHRPLETYAAALSSAGLLIEQIREPALPEHAIQRLSSRRWQRLPLFLHIRAVKP